MAKKKLDKAAFEALDETTQKLYKFSDAGYTLEDDGVKTTSDVEALQESLRKEREDHKAAKAQVKALEAEKGSLTDKVTVYESDESKKLGAEERLEMARLKRELETKTAEYDTLSGSHTELQGSMTLTQVKAELRKAAKGVIREDALDDTVNQLAGDFTLSDGKVLTSTAMGDKSGLEAKAYLPSYVKDRSYLAPTSSGGGSGGGQGSGVGSQTETESSMGQIMTEVWNPK